LNDEEQKSVRGFLLVSATRNSEMVHDLSIIQLDYRLDIVDTHDRTPEKRLIEPDTGRQRCVDSP
jgi:hypothetical protein